MHICVCMHYVFFMYSNISVCVVVSMYVCVVVSV